MGSQIRNKILKFANLSKSELIWRNVLGKGDLTSSVNKFKGVLNNLKDMHSLDAMGIASYNPKPFNKYPTTVVKTMIDESLNTLKEKNLFRSIDLYNTIIESYLRNNIQFQIESLTEEIKKNKIKFNEKTYELLIGYYCGHGQMDLAEHLVNEMKSLKDTVKNQWKMNMIMGYIISGQPEKSKEFIKNNNLDENNINTLIYEAYGYASIGDISKVLRIINKLKEKNLNLFSHNFTLLYWRLAQTNLTESELSQVLDTFSDPQPYFVLETVTLLNRMGLFNRSLALIEKYRTKLTLPVATDLITSFNTKECPSEIYTTLLDSLLEMFNIRHQVHLFANMSYNEARSFANVSIMHRSCNAIYMSLINRAISTQSIDLIGDSLSFGFDHMKRNTLNLILQIKFVPTMLETGTARDILHIIELLPEHRQLLLPVVMMYSLSCGNFSEFDQLLLAAGGTQKLQYHIHSMPLVNYILRNLTITEVARFASEAARAFDTDLVNFLLLKIAISKIITASRMDDVTGVLDAVCLAETHQITFNMSTMNYLKSHAPRHAAVYQRLFNNTSGMEIIFDKDFDVRDSVDESL